MAKVYVMRCRDAGVDCDFEARGSSMEDVLQRSADHSMKVHNMQGFGPELYSKLQRAVKVEEEDTGPAC